MKVGEASIIGRRSQTLKWRDEGAGKRDEGRSDVGREGVIFAQRHGGAEGRSFIDDWDGIQ